MTSPYNKFPAAAAYIAKGAETGELAPIVTQNATSLLEIIAYSTGLDAITINPFLMVWQRFTTCSKKSNIDPIKQYQSAPKHGRALEIYLKKQNAAIASYETYLAQLEKESPEQAATFSAVVKLHRTLNHSAFQRIPLNQIIQIISSNLKDLNQNDFCAFLVNIWHPNLVAHSKNILHYKDIEKLPVFAENYIKPIKEILEDHPRSHDFFVAFKEQKLEKIKDTLINELQNADSVVEMKEAAAFNLLTAAQKAAICEERTDAIIQEISASILKMLTSLQSEFNLYDSEWARALHEQVKAKKVDWDYALNTTELAIAYIYAHSRNTPLHSLLESTAFHHKQPKLEDIGSEFHVINQLVKKWENSCTGGALNNQSYLMPGTLNIHDNPEYIHIAAARIDQVLSQVLSMLLKLLPKAATAFPPTQRQKRLGSTLIGQFIPDELDEKPRKAITEWLTSIYLPTSQPAAKSVMTEGANIQHKEMEKFNQFFLKNKCTKSEEVLILISAMHLSPHIVEPEVYKSGDRILSGLFNSVLTTSLPFCFNTHIQYLPTADAQVESFIENLGKKPGIISATAHSKQQPGIARFSHKPLREKLVEPGAAPGAFRLISGLQVFEAAITYRDALYTRLQQAISSKNPTTGIRSSFKALLNMWQPIAPSVAQILSTRGIDLEPSEAPPDLTEWINRMTAPRLKDDQVYEQKQKSPSTAWTDCALALSPARLSLFCAGNEDFFREDEHTPEKTRTSRVRKRRPTPQKLHFAKAVETIKTTAA